jgi:ubiquinone/menaquinone biosynthesis C-methylase UbiE
MLELSNKNLRGIPLTIRDVDGYCECLNVDRGYFNKAGEIILDLGSGLFQDLARSANRNGLKSEIISVDPTLSAQSNNIHFARTEKYVNKLDNHPKTVSAYSELLPFRENTFDKIIALFSIPFYSQSTKHFIQSLQEMIRSVKIGGEIKISPYPVIGNPKVDYEKVNEFLNEQVSDGRINFQKEIVEKKIGGVSRVLTIKKLK